ncbi:MAG: hypothetical protein GY822_30570 [Deltaproteobacteria bacterium]|nr:hypothetical protein [Deltaproteobacteria bacterium]
MSSSSSFTCSISSSHATSRAIAFALLSTSLTACVSHVQLPTAPTQHAPLAERQAFYDEYAPLTIRQPAVVTGQLASYSGPLSYVILQNGTRVQAPEDLCRCLTSTALLLALRFWPKTQERVRF